MTKIAIPYGEKMVEFSLPEETFIGMTDPPAAQAAENPEKEIEEAMEHPIGMGGLETVVFPGAKVAVITDDGSRPTPVKMILPILLKKLSACGVRREDIVIVMALGSHRYMTEDEIRERVGDAVYKSYRVVNSEFRQKGRLLSVGETDERTPILATREVVEADIRIGVGNLVPHPVMGWGGGGKIIFPGVTGEDIVAYFHLKASMYNENMFGMDVTPVRRMMESWMQYISLDFIINTIMTQDLKISRVVAGHYIEAQRAGVAIAKKVQGCPVKEKADVVIVSSHPADQDFWQSPKALYGAEPALKGEEGGTMILVSPNYEGIGPHPEYPEYMGRENGGELVKNYLRGNKTEGDPLAIAVGNSMAKMRRRRNLVVVGNGVTKEQMEKCGCRWYPIEELQRAVDEAVSQYDSCRAAVLSAGAETFLYTEEEKNGDGEG